MSYFTRVKLALRGRLQSAASQDDQFLVALNAFDFAVAHHTGTRKDGSTPEFQHQVATTERVLALSQGLLFPAESLAVMLLHDTAEDCGVELAQIRERFGARVEDAVRRLTKVHRGIRKGTSGYFGEIAECPMASVCKGADRLHNQETMTGVFSPAKQVAYKAETRAWLVPAIARARQAFPAQEAAYAALSAALRLQEETVVPCT